MDQTGMKNIEIFHIQDTQNHNWQKRGLSPFLSIILEEGKMFDLKEELKKLPEKPGVYIMRDKNNNILYVGKAVILKNRVKQYFNKTAKTTSS